MISGNEYPFAVIWDVDGTLVDTAELHYRAWKELADSRGWPFSREDFRATFGRRNPEIIHLLFGSRFTERETAELGEAKEELYRTAARNGVELLPGVRPLVEELHRAGVVQAVGSSAPRKNLELILDLTRTAGYFQAIVAMEDTSRGKPDPQVFQLAAQQLAVPPERSVVFEDAVAGVQAARAGGMKCVAVTFVGHHPAEKLRTAGADLVVDTLEKITVDQIRALLFGG
jgi:beta-phosphoglucomutase